jgi:choline dehydrogenase-like flavoprotein
MDHQHDEDGGYVVEASTIQDPIGFAAALQDDNGPMWGRPLVDAVRKYRHWNGVLAMVNDENNATVELDDQISVSFNERERKRLDDSLAFSREVLLAAGAKQVLWSGLASTHVQGSCRMGDDPELAVVNRNGETHEVKRLYVGDGSLVPRTLSVNPSLTIMALATRLADHLDSAA